MADERDRLLEPMTRIGEVGPKTWARLAAIGEKFAERNGNQEPTYLCPVCCDTGFVIRPKPDKFGDMCTVATPCEGGERPCLGRQFISDADPGSPGGISIEAGYWAQRLRPPRGVKDGQAHPAARAAFLRRMRSHPFGVELRDAVDRIIAAMGKA